MVSRSLAVLVLLLLAGLAVGTSAAASGPEKRLDSILARERARLGVPGVQAAIMRRGRLAWSGESGSLESGRRGRAVRGGDPFVLASVGKLLTATMVVRLAEEGRLSLEDPLSRFVPEVPNADRISIAMLLAHRSGLRDYPEDPAVAARLSDPHHGWTSDELVGDVARLGAEGEPGGAFAYRNTNYVLLGRVLERAGGAGVEALTGRLLKRPLRLRSLGWQETRRTAHGHEPRGRRLVDLARGPRRIPSDALGPVWTDGGVAASARDVARFGDALFRARLVGRGFLHRMTATRDGYGLGVDELRRGRGRRLLGHAGAYGGYTAVLAHDPRRKLTVAVTANRLDEDLPAVRIGERLLQALTRRSTG